MRDHTTLGATITPRTARYLLGTLLLLVGLGALGGGYYGMTGAKGVPAEWLEGTPFGSYFVPSLILFVVVGVSLVLGGFAVWMRWPSSARFAASAGAVLLGWITVQMAIIGYVSWLQPGMGAVGLLALALAPLIETR